MNSVALYGPENIDQLIWPRSQSAELARSFLLPVIKQGVQSFIRNIDCRLYLLVVENEVIPLTINDCEYNNSYVVSNYFPINYWQEQLSKKGSFQKAIQLPLSLAAGTVFKGVKINKIILINNWLFPTNIHSNLSEQVVESITTLLKSQFSEHLISVRGLNVHHYLPLLDRLKAKGYRLMKTRFVHIYDPAVRHKLPSKVLRSHRRDERLIIQHGYEVMSTHDFAKSDILRLLELYRMVYMDKYTAYSAHYSELYMEHMLENGIMEFVGLKKEGIIDGVFATFRHGNEIIVPFFGYDKQLPVSPELYRMLATLIVKKAENQKLVLNNSSGAFGPKKNRGHTLALEYTAFYDRHLSLPRRTFWGLSTTIMNKIIF